VEGSRREGAESGNSPRSGGIPHAREILNWWPYYAPNPLRGGASKGFRDSKGLSLGDS